MVKRYKGIRDELNRGGYRDENERYRLLRAAILSQAITDYRISSRNIRKGFKSRTWMMYWEKLHKDCIDFFNSPIYDFEDVDTRKLLKMLDEAIDEELCVS